MCIHPLGRMDGQSGHHIHVTVNQPQNEQTQCTKIGLSLNGSAAYREKFARPTTWIEGERCSPSSASLVNFEECATATCAENVNRGHGDAAAATAPKLQYARPRVEDTRKYKGARSTESERNRRFRITFCAKKLFFIYELAWVFKHHI